MERIERENLKIASRIFDLKPSVQITEMEHDFQLHKRYSEGMRKIVKRKSVPRHGGKQGHLPPITAEGDNNEQAALQLASDLNLSSQDTINRVDTNQKSNNTIDENEIAARKA